MASGPLGISWNITVSSARIEMRDVKSVATQTRSERRRLSRLFALLLAANALAWAWAFAQFAGRPALLGTALVATMFGLRHAVDADHIAAIDNVVRKLMQDGERPFGAGLF